MYCKKIMLVHWGNIPNLEFEFGPVNLFSGGNGSGKTTAADAIQSLMTAAYENLFNYNPGQEETTQRGRGGKQVRTLASYVLGCDDGSYARLKPTDGYIVGVFHPTTGESGIRFSAVMAVRAAIETVGKQRQARQRELAFFIVPNEELTLDLFFEDQVVTNLDTLLGKLQNNFGKKNVEYYDKKGAYLNRLYGAMRGQKGSVPRREAQHAAKTFSNFMAYKPVKSINDFVAREILEPRDLGDNIKQVSELMKTIHSMESETRQITEVIENLHQISDLSEGYINHWLQWRLDEYREVVRQSWVKQREFLETKDKLGENGREKKQAEARLLGLQDKQRSLHGKLVTLEAKRQGIPALRNKDELERAIAETESSLVQHAQPLLSAMQQLDQNCESANSLHQQIQQSSDAIDLPVLENKKLQSELKKVFGLGTETGVDMQVLLTEDFAGIVNLEAKLDGLVEFEKVHTALAARLHLAETSSSGKETLSIRDQVLALVNQRQQNQTRFSEMIAGKKREIQKLERHAVSYPPHVEAAIRAIEQGCPQARPSVLCDFIDVVEPQWQMAIEGYIGGSRFGILVEPDFEAEAIRIVRNMPGRRNNAKVIQGSRAQSDAARRTMPDGSITEVMKFDHKIAEYYIKASYGDVRRVKDEHALRKVARGITADGMGAGGYSMFRCDLDEADLVFGQAARERALKAKQSQLDDLQVKGYAAEQGARGAAQVLATVDKIQTINISAIVRTMLDLYRRKERDQQSLSMLDLSDFKKLEEELRSLNIERETVVEDLGTLQKRRGQLDSQFEVLERQLQEAGKQKEKLQEKEDGCELGLEEITGIYSEFDANAALAEARNSAEKYATVMDASDSFVDDMEAHLGHCRRAERQLFECVKQHNIQCRASDNIAYLVDSSSDIDTQHNREWFKHVVQVAAESRSITNRLRNNVLVGKHEQLADLRDGFNTAFVTDLCHSIYQSINDGKRILDDLNKELETHRFGTDQEQYYFDYDWVPEFREYHRFFKEVIHLPSLGDGNSLFEAELSDKSKVIREKLLSMLLDNDEVTATRELKRLSDYRHYREYEIYKQPKDKEPIALSQYGTGSGGQLETPAYIIRSAAVTSAFRFNEGNTHCRMVLVDEAFSKMDESRSREVINYLTNELGLQLLFIMPTSKSGPFMDLISHQIIFSKCPSQKPVGELNSQVLVDRKVCNQEMIKDLWARHRRDIRTQTQLDFMQEFIAPDVENVASESA